jgi:hypothetical protein
MVTQTIRYSKWYRGQLIFSAAALVVFLLFFVWTFLGLTGMAGLRDLFSLLGAVLDLLVLFVFLLFLIMTVVTIYRMVGALYYRLYFSDTSLIVLSFSGPGRKSKEYPYADILRVKRGLVRGELIVETAGSPLRLTPFLYEGREKRLLAEFAKRLPPEKIEPDLENSLRKFKKYDAILYPLLIGLFAGIFIINFQSGGIGLIRPRIGWPDAVPWKLGTFYKALSVDEAGTAWFATTNVDTKSTRVGRADGGSTRVWDIPAAAFEGGDGAYDISGVTGNAEGDPVVFLESYMLSWNGAEWIDTPLPGEILNYLGYSVAGNALQYITSVGNLFTFYSCDLNRLECEAFSMPDAITAGGMTPWAYKGSAGGPAVAAAAKEGLIAFYQFRDGSWVQLGGELDLPIADFMAFTLDSHNALWVTKSMAQQNAWDRYTQGPLAFGRCDDAQGEWQWSSLDAFTGSFEQGVDYMEVDPRGRIWIAGHYRTADVGIGETAGVYTVGGGKAEEIIRYTDANSNFQTGISDCGLVQGPDGRMWSCDSGLVSLDSRAEKLPSPLPEWLSDLGNHKYRFIGLGVVCALELVYFAVLGILFVKRRASKSAAPNP